MRDFGLLLGVVVVGLALALAITTYALLGWHRLIIVDLVCAVIGLVCIGVLLMTR